MPVPKNCPKCNDTEIKYTGIGIQKAEEELKKHFPSVKMLRMDADSINDKSAYEKNLNDRNGNLIYYTINYNYYFIIKVNYQ